jgi:sec-independent protein translocase protein TatA
MFGTIGMPELVIISVIALIIFGPAKLPDFGKPLGEAIRGFEEAIIDAAKSTLERPHSPTQPSGSSKP